MGPWCKRASLLTLTFGFLVLLRTCTGTVTCPNGYSQHGNLCYSFYRDPKSFDDANAFCKTSGGQELVSWNNDDNIGRFLQRQANGVSAYIGLRDIYSNGRYYWMDRHTEYSNTPGSRLWDPHEPSTADERCVQLDAGKGFKLNDVSCHVPFAFVCKACSVIDKCLEPECKSGPDSRSTSCRKCQPTYIPTPDHTHCEKACEYNNPCWPGQCAGNYLRNCVCKNGFQEVTRDGRNHCQLGTSMHPELETCRMKVFVKGGKMTDSPSNSTSTSCANMLDFYGNYKPEVVNLDLLTSFTVDVKSFPTPPGAYQTNEANFGVTDVKVQLLKKPLTGHNISDSQNVLLADTSQGKSISNTFSEKTNLTYSTNLSNGDRLCAEIEVKGGGYMRTKDTWNSDKAFYYEYDKTSTSRSLCYIMDTAKPLHKSAQSPLEVSESITRTGLVNVSFTDWIDPFPTVGDPTLASGIEKYEITLYDLKYADGTQSVGSIIRSKSVLGTEAPMVELNLTFSLPKLVCILLEVKDVADNVGFARRFVLFDNTSSIAVDTSKVFEVTSASPASHLKWQTHHNNICMSWRDYFTNKVYMDNPFLDPINPDPNIPDRYDQGSGELPVSGTPNVHGVIAYHFSWSRNGGEPHHEGPVPNFLNQTLCSPIPLLDGETYTLNITAIDVVNNTLTESRTVSIDRTVPHINNIWLVNEGQDSLFVHGDENGDLNELTISFEVLDPHSGVEEIQWALGTADGKMDIASRNISVNESDSCKGIHHCICPSVGLCQVTKYFVSLKGNNLKAGNHNRNYYFTIKATNHARLSNIEHLEILVDISPPETGVVFEGPHGSSDMDYTSSPDFMVRWHGFVDHESGIMGYRIALSERCLTKHELGNTTFLSSSNTTIADFHETSSTENSVRMRTNFTGKYHVTVVAINNAAQLSEPACSDGITRDVTRPTLRNLTLINGRWRETVHCMNNSAWLLHSSLLRIRLDDVPACMQLCNNKTSLFQMPGLIPELARNASDEMISEFICRKNDQYSDNEFIYLPNDHLELTWDIDEDGSQIEEIYVGLGTDQSQSISPNLRAYTPTNRRSFYRQSHAGFSTDDPFYVFVKVTNKADIDSTSSLGPIIIDETPPVRMTPIEVITNSTHVVVGWENQTFVDPEQPDPISSIFFQIESDGEAISPLLEWNLHDSPSCVDYSGGCITYPLRRLQDKDTVYGRYYVIVLHVFNNAGHELRTSTNTFKIPSKYPPGHGRVRDIDPSVVTQNPDDVAMVTDISAHTTNNTLCCTWTGFEHHENMSLEIGVGTSPDTDTVYPFRRIPNNGSACLQSPKFHTNVKFFVSIRASCSGGATISSSDGVVIVNVTEITDALVVQNGRDCRKLSNRQTDKLIHHDNNSTAVINERIVSVNTSLLSNNSFFLDRPLRVGYTYFLQMYNNELRKPVDFETLDGNAEVIDEFWYKVVPFSDKPSFRFVNNYTSTSQYSILVHECYNGSYIDDNSIINGYWSLDINVSLPLTFEIAVGIYTNSNKINTSNIRQISLFEKVNSDKYASLPVNSTDPGAVFRILVRPCIEHLCLPYVAGPGIKFIGRPVEIEINEAIFTVKDCSNVDIKLSLTYTDDSSFFQWTICRDSKATHILDNWRTVLMDKVIYNISACTSAPIHDRETIYVCVKAFTWSSSSTLKCALVNTAVMENDKKQLVYEFDTTQPSWPTTKKLLNSRYLGGKTTEMLDSELDFGNSSTIVASAMSMASERNVTWYLMTSKFVPDTCSVSRDCITSHTTTSSGYTTFQPEVIPTNRILYSCVYSNLTVVEREQHVETLDEIKSCSDGFFIDTVSPSAGVLVVPNHNRYITDVRRTVIYWDGFTDNMDTVALGYPSSIKHYVVSAGSTAGGDDLLPLTNIGHEHTYMLDEMDRPDGTSFFLTVTGEDHAGLQVSLTSDLLVLDTSPPSSGRVHIQGTSGTMFVISADMLNIHLSGFNDPHSGIDHFEIGIGSQSRVADLVPVRTYTTNYVAIVLKDFQPADGRQYFVIVQAVNRAGLSTEPVSTSFVIDRTPPSGGHVLDGAAAGRKDVDFQNNGTYIAGHWYGFTDHHSAIQYYRVGLGSRPYMDDMEFFTDVGLTTNVKWRRSLTPGAKYYITVEACNGARLCKQVSSDGIITDQSAPIPGRVRVGYQGNHGKYQSKNTSVHIQWSGFSDTESGIDHFEVCLGTGPDICDVHPIFNCLLSSSITKTGLNIPGNRDVYAIVKAFNNVGMSAMVTSDVFRVDSFPPILIETPSIVTMNSFVNKSNIQYDPSVLRLRWKFEDHDSPITSHFVTLKTHHEGHTPIENLELGPTDGVTISLDRQDWLHDGDTYYVIVTSCNAAGLCTSAQTDEVIIDSTPPHQGGFTSDLRWRNFPNGTSEVSLSSHSFADAESGVDVFFITISRDYSGSELSDGVISREIVNGSTPTLDGTFRLMENIHQNDKLYLTIWAKNRAGLNSSVSRISVNALVTKKDGASVEGRLEIEKHSCQPQFCSGDCTCAVVGKPCEKPTCPSTSSYNLTEEIPKVIVQWELTDMSQNLTTSSACLAAQWSTLPISNGTRPNISRHEYSISIQGEAFGVGVLPGGRVPWIDVGRRQNVVHCLTGDLALRHGEAYVFYVRTWTSRDAFFIAESSPIVVDKSPPSIKKGAHIRDSDTSCKRDLDIIDWMNTITGCWSNVFIEQQSTIEYYTVALGTSENSDDVLPTRTMGLQMSITLTNISMQHGTKYFFTVTAYTSVGLHTTLFSDGFIIDMDTPRKGVVYNTNAYKNADFQSNTTVFSLSWTGFSDDQSGIRSYQVALVGDLGVNTGNVTFHDAQMTSQYTFRGVNLQPGMMYHGLVKAFDATGHESAIVTSPGRVIDNTGPEGFQCTYFDRVSSTELAANQNTSLRALLTTQLIKNRLYKINGTIYNPDTNSVLYVKNGDNRVRVPFAVTHEGSIHLDHSFLNPYTGDRSIELLIESSRGILGNVTLWQCNGTKTTRNSSIDVKQIGPTLLTVTVNVRDMESGIYKVLLGVGSTPGGFQIRPLESISGGNTGLLEIEEAHGTSIHVTAVTENHAGLKSTFSSTPLVLDHTGPELVIVDASITPVNETIDDFNGSDTVPVMVNVTWSVTDRESGVQSCFCSFGHLPRSGDLMSYTPADSNSHCTSDVFRLSHGTSIHANVQCVNNVQIKTETTTSEIKVIYDPPSEVHAQVNFITMGTSRAPEAVHQINGDLAIQSSLDRLAFEWLGFMDNTGIANYEYRLREKNHIIVDWRQTEKSAASLTFHGTTALTAGKTYSIDVMAVNKAGLRSIPRQAVIIVDDRKPQLTGTHPLVLQNGRMVRIDWRPVFRHHSTFSCLYAVVVGTREGCPDVADIRDTTDTVAKVELPVTRSEGDGVQEINIGVECVYPTGLSRMVTFNYRLDKYGAIADN